MNKLSKKRVNKRLFFNYIQMLVKSLGGNNARHKSIRGLLFFLISILTNIPTILFSQADSIETKKKFWSNKSISVSYQNGYIFPTNIFLRGQNASVKQLDDYQSLSLRFITQTTGENMWEQLFNYPRWGIGLNISDFNNSIEIGRPIALYAFLNAPFVRWENSSFNYELAFGLSTNWKSFNPVTNQYNVAIGAPFAFFIDAGLNYRFAISKQFDLEAGFSLTHFSNGALKVPNFGINTIAPKLSVIYNLQERPEFIERPMPKFKPHFEWEFSTFAGLKNLVFSEPVQADIIEQYEGLFFPVFGLSATLNRHVSRKSKFGLGANFLYNSTANAQDVAIKAINSDDFDPITGSLGDKAQISLFLSYELVMNRMSLILQPACYIYRKKTTNQTPIFHQRIGLKYSITDNIFVGITLRDYSFRVSDFIEWSVGYRINGNKK